MRSPRHPIISTVLIIALVIGYFRVPAVKSSLQAVGQGVLNVTSKITSMATDDSHAPTPGASGRATTSTPAATKKPAGPATKSPSRPAPKSPHTERLMASADYAAAILASGNVSGPRAVFSDLHYARAGKGVPNDRHNDTCGRKSVHLATSSLMVLYKITLRYKVYLNNLLTGHGCDPYLHPRGRAFDVDRAISLRHPAQRSSFGSTFGHDNPSFDRAFDVYVASILPKNGHGIYAAGLGQMQCPMRGIPRASSTLRRFTDSCTHQHIDVGYPGYNP